MTDERYLEAMDTDQAVAYIRAGHADARTTPNPGVTRCPCCGDDHYGPVLLCGDCQSAGCEMSTDASGDTSWFDCQRERDEQCSAETDFHACTLGAGHWGGHRDGAATWA